MIRPTQISTIIGSTPIFLTTTLLFHSAVWMDQGCITKCCSWLFVFLLIYIIYVFCIFSHVERSRDVYLLFYLNGDMHCHHHLLIKSLSFGWNGTNIVVILVIINRRRSLLLDWFEDVMNAERLHLNTQCFHHGVI